MKNVIEPLAKSVLIPLELTAAALAADAGIHKKISGSGNTTLIISNDEMEDIRIVISLNDPGLLLTGVSETIQNAAKEQNGEILSMLLDTLSASLLDNILAGEGMNRVGEGFSRAGYGSSIKNKDF